MRLPPERVFIWCNYCILRLLSEVVKQASETSQPTDPMVLGGLYRRFEAAAAASSPAVQSSAVKVPALPHLVVHSVVVPQHISSLYSQSVIIQQRACDSPSACKKTWREWNATQTEDFQRAFAERFPRHQVLTINSADANWTECVSCQVREYGRADVLVGLHGAGMFSTARTVQLLQFCCNGF